MEVQKKENISMRGRKFTGKVTSAKMARTVVVVLERRIYNQKYERYQKRSTRIKAHVPFGVEVNEGDLVTVHETRPISKTKHFQIIKVHTEENKKDNVEKQITSSRKNTKKA